MDFLYKLGSGASMIRVRDLELQPDPPRQRLSANIRLVASYQKNSTAAAAAKTVNRKGKMKTTLLALVLALTGLELWAQTSPSLPTAGPLLRLPRFGTNGPVTLPRYKVPHRRPPKRHRRPSLKPTAQPEEMIPAGHDQFSRRGREPGAGNLRQLVDRTLLRASLPKAQIVLKTQTPLTKTEAIEALQAVLALNGISVVNIGDKFVKVVPVADANSFGAEFNDANATNLPDLGSYVTHIVQLKYVKPSEMVPIIQPFAKLPNSILPIDSNGILVLRDYAENVKRMLEMIDEDGRERAGGIHLRSHPDPIRGSGGHRQRVEQPGRQRRLHRELWRQHAAARQSAVCAAAVPAASAAWAAAVVNPAALTAPWAATARPYSVSAPTAAQRHAHRRHHLPAAPATTSSTALPAPKPAAAPSRIKSRCSARPKSSPTRAAIRCWFSPRGRTWNASNRSSRQLDVLLAQVLIESVIMDVDIGNTLNFGVSAAQHPKQFNNSNVAGGGAMNNGQLLHF